MHEMSICEAIIEQLEEQAVAQDYSRVKTLWLEIGALAGIELESLRFCFDIICNNTLAAGATLEIVETPGQGWCPKCIKSVHLSVRYDACPDCGSYPLQITNGEQMKIKQLEVE